jgi:hypothetical protein
VSRSRVALALLALIASAPGALLCPGVARADEPVAHRAVPDYDGRGAAPAPPEESWLWIPRVVLAPLYVLTEYGLRRPVGWALREADRARLPQQLALAGANTSRVRLQVYPTLVVDAGLSTFVGLHADVRGLGAAPNSLRVHGATGGAGAWAGSIADRYAIAERSFVALGVTFLERSDWRYYGTGPRTAERDAQVFNHARTDARLAAELGAWQHGGLALATGVRWDTFGAPTLSVSSQQQLAGYDDHGAVYGVARGFLDSRPLADANASGVRVAASVETAADVDADARSDRRWLGYELEGAAFLEVMHPARVLSAHAYVDFADARGRAPVPFMDLVTLGGFGSMRGFYAGRFRGESAALFAVHYRYPIAAVLDAELYLETGNAFGPHLAGFAPAALYGSAALGVRTRDLGAGGAIELLVGFGTSRFDEPFAVTSGRFVLGLNRGF